MEFWYGGLSVCLFFFSVYSWKNFHLNLISRRIPSVTTSVSKRVIRRDTHKYRDKIILGYVFFIHFKNSQIRFSVFPVSLNLYTFPLFFYNLFIYGFKFLFSHVLQLHDSSDTCFYFCLFLFSFMFTFWFCFIVVVEFCDFRSFVFGRKLVAL